MKETGLITQIHPVLRQKLPCTGQGLSRSGLNINVGIPLCAVHHRAIAGLTQTMLQG